MVSTDFDEGRNANYFLNNSSYILRFPSPSPVPCYICPNFDCHLDFLPRYPKFVLFFKINIWIGFVLSVKTFLICFYVSNIYLPFVFCLSILNIIFPALYLLLSINHFWSKRRFFLASFQYYYRFAFVSHNSLTIDCYCFVISMSFFYFVSIKNLHFIYSIKSLLRFFNTF